MSSHEPFTVQPVDLLIADALRAEVAGAEPSRRVWARIRRRAGIWAARHRPRSAWNWNVALGLVPQADIAFPLPVMSRSGVISYSRYDLAATRFLDYAGMMFRFGW